jgi:hypothetical protein
MIVATPLPIRFVTALASFMKRSTPSRITGPATGTVWIEESVAASVTNPAPAPPAAELGGAAFKRP